jgi:lysophospholipase L1-like esterase
MKMKLQKFIVAALLVCIAFSSVSFGLTKWACVGDSITAGWKLKEPATYTYKLGVLLGSGYETVNYGHSARTMLRAPVEGWPYWESPMFTASQAYLPDIVTIMLGTNDAHPNNWPMLADDYYVDAVDMVTIYQNLPSNPRVILMTVPPAKNGGREPALTEVNVVLMDVVAATGCETVDVRAAIDNSGLSENEKFIDPIHLSAMSHTIIAELLYDYITGGGSACDDGTCDPGEDQCNCPEDCGTPPSTETSCDDGIDNDCGGGTDCDDSDCDGDPACPDCQPKNGACTDNADCCSGNCRPSGRCA